MRSHRFVVVTVLVLAAVLGAALPALAAGNAPPYFSSSGQTLVYTASSGSQPQGAIIGGPPPGEAIGGPPPGEAIGSPPPGAIIGGRYIRLDTEDCPMPARMLVDGQVVYVCPRPVKLPSLPRPPLRLP